MELYKPGTMLLSIFFDKDHLDLTSATLFIRKDLLIPPVVAMLRCSELIQLCLTTKRCKVYILNRKRKYLFWNEPRKNLQKSNVRSEFAIIRFVKVFRCQVSIDVLNLIWRFDLYVLRGLFKFYLFFSSKDFLRVD